MGITRRGTGRRAYSAQTTAKIVVGIVIDLILVAFSIYAAYALRYEFHVPSSVLSGLESKLLFYLAIHLVIYLLMGLYRQLSIYTSVSEIIKLAASEIIATTCCFLLSMIGPGKRLPMSVAVISCALSILLVTLAHMSPRLFRYIRFAKVRRQASDPIPTLIIGAGDAGVTLAQEYAHMIPNNHRVVGFLDDDAGKVGMEVHGTPVLGTIDDVAAVCRRTDAREIVIAIPSASRAQINRILDECRKTECKTRIMASVHELKSARQLSPSIRDVDISDLLSREEVILDTTSIAGYLTEKVVMVTGGGGSIGSELCRQIIQYDPKLLIILDIYENNAYDLQMELAMKYGLRSDKVKVIIGSVRDREMLRRVFAKYRPEVVLHAAAHKHVPLMEDSPLEALKNNVFGTYNVANTAGEFGARRMVLISTDKAVNPTNVMGASKRLAEMVILGTQHKYATEYVAVRFGNVLGSNGSVLPLFRKQIAQGGPVTVTDPEITRFFMTIPEAARLVLQAGAMAKGGEIFILDMGKPVRIADMARDLIKLSGFEPDRDIMIEYVGLRPGEKLYEELMLAEEGTTETSSKKIFTAKPQDLTVDELEGKLDLLRRCIDEDGDVRSVLKQVVPTYMGNPQT